MEQFLGFYSTLERVAPVSGRTKFHTNISVLEGGPLSSKTALALTSKSPSTFPINNLHFLSFITLRT